mmetsp:Transcript_6910/g.21796  ORF Transcript_6910/g.21796 Transcript_6910/m.21796 type:complete len:91 (+) Transcript_6910:2714-2986(+)
MAVLLIFMRLDACLFTLGLSRQKIQTYKPKIIRFRNAEMFKLIRYKPKNYHHKPKRMFKSGPEPRFWGSRASAVDSGRRPPPPRGTPRSS